MRGFWLLLSAVLLPFGCGGSPGTPGTAPSPAPLRPEGAPPASLAEELGVLDSPTSFSAVNGSIQDDSRIEALVAPFRARMGEEIQQVIGEATGILSKAVPEGTLGNFAADAMLWAANSLIPAPAHMALTNNGGLRVPIGSGPITTGQMYELMPFENMLSILVLTGLQVQKLCNELAEKMGEPIAGFSFHIGVEDDHRVAQDIMVQGKPLDREAEYLLVTNDYLANGGESLSTLQSPVAREDLPVLLRDAFIDYVKHLGVIEPKMEGRITGGIGG